MSKTHFELGELPSEFQETADYLKAKDKPSGWLLEAVDSNSPTAVFVKGGKPWYLSPCPHYEGFWLDGHIGSVQCKLAGQLIPGYFWHIFCREKCSECPYSKQAASSM